MWRRVNRTQYQANNGEKPDNKYFENLVKYIPSEVIGAWVAIKGLVTSTDKVPKDIILWMIFILLTGITAFYIYKQTSDTNKEEIKPQADITQIVISTLAFIVWVFALGEPFSSLPFYQPVYGSIILILYNLIIPLI